MFIYLCGIVFRRMLWFQTGACHLHPGTSEHMVNYDHAHQRPALHVQAMQWHSQEGRCWVLSAQGAASAATCHPVFQISVLHQKRILIARKRCGNALSFSCFFQFNCILNIACTVYSVSDNHSVMSDSL